MFDNFNIRSESIFNIFSLQDNKDLTLRSRLFGQIDKYYFIISRQKEYSPRYFRIKAYDSLVYTSVENIIDIAAPGKTTWIKVFNPNTPIGLNLDISLSNHEIVQLELLANADNCKR